MKKIATFILIFVIVVSSVFAYDSGVYSAFGFSFQGNESASSTENFRATIDFSMAYHFNGIFSSGATAKVKYWEGSNFGVSSAMFDILPFIRVRGNLGDSIGNIGFYTSIIPAGIEMDITTDSFKVSYIYGISMGWDLKMTERCFTYVEFGINGAYNSNGIGFVGTTVGVRYSI